MIGNTTGELGLTLAQLLHGVSSLLFTTGACFSIWIITAWAEPLGWWLSPALGHWCSLDGQAGCQHRGFQAACCHLHS